MTINIKEASIRDLSGILNLYSLVLDKGNILTEEQAEILFKKI